MNDTANYYHEDTNTYDAKRWCSDNNIDPLDVLGGDSSEAIDIAARMYAHNVAAQRWQWRHAADAIPQHEQDSQPRPFHLLALLMALVGFFATMLPAIVFAP